MIPGRPIRHVGYVFQKDTLFPWRTVEDNIGYALETRGRAGGRAPPRGSTEAIHQAGLDGFARFYPASLSGGMRQRVSLMRTLISRPEILLMDEPFGALDTHTKLDMHSVLLDLWERQRQTVLFVTHDLGEALTLADRIILMSARPGRVKQDFEVDFPRPRDAVALRETPQYAALFSRIWHSLGEEFAKGHSDEAASETALDPAVAGRHRPGALAVWQWGWELHDKLPWLVPDLLDPYFVSKPSAIFQQFLTHRLPGHVRRRLDAGRARRLRALHRQVREQSLDRHLLHPEEHAVGLPDRRQLGLRCSGSLLGRSDRLSEIFYPYITAFNSIPRIALAPIIILAFGIGDASKIVTAWLVVVFLVFFNTFEGARSVDRDHINAARLLGASEWQVTRTVIVPSTMAWLFASLSPAISFSLIGVIVGEFIGAEHGIGRMIIEAEARGEAAGMMVAVFVLMIAGVILSLGVRRLQTYLLALAAGAAIDGIECLPVENCFPPHSNGEVPASYAGGGVIGFRKR